MPTSKSAGSANTMPMTPRLRAMWTLFDQLLVSLRNFILLWIVIREFSPSLVGAFGIVYTTYFLAMALARGLSGDPLVVRYSGASDAEWADATARSFSAMLIAATVLAVAIILPGLALGGPLWLAMAALGFCLPALLAQDHMRIAAFSRGRPDRASLNDLLVLGLLVLGLIGLLAGKTLTMTLVVATWGLACLLGVAAAFLGGDLRGCRGGGQWLREHTDIGPAFATDAVANRGTEQLTQVAIAIISGIGTVGVLTASRTLFAPMTTIQTGVNTFIMPEVARRARERRLDKVPRLVAGIASVLVVAMMMTAGVFVLLPDPWGEVIFADNWERAVSIIWPMAVFSAFNAIAFSYWAALKALARARSTLLIRLVGGVLGAGAAVMGASSWGAAGATWGMAIGSAVTALWLGIDMNRSIKQERTLHATSGS